MKVAAAPSSCVLACSFPPGGGGGYSHTWAIYVCVAPKVVTPAVLVINKVSILTDFDQFGHKGGMVFVL